MKQFSGVMATTLLLSTAALAGGTETRQRFAVMNGDVKFSVTRIDQTSETLSSTTILLVDETRGGAYRLDSTRNYAAQTAEYRFTDAASKEHVATRFKLPLKAKTRSETAAELRHGVGSTATIEMTLSSAAATATLDELTWRNDSKSRQAKGKVRSTLSPAFTTTLERLQTVLSVPPLLDFCHELINHVQTGGCGPNPSVLLSTLPPDCGFDTANGEPCSKEQRSRADKARKAGRYNRY